MNCKSKMLLCVLSGMMVATSKAADLFSAMMEWHPYVVYGDKDQRYDLYEIADSNLLALAHSTVALINADRLQLQGDRFVYVDQKTLAEEDKVCPDEHFALQKTLPYCSGSLIAPDLVLTAGHCITSEAECQDTRFVFGFSVATNGAAPNSAPASEVYSCKKLIRSVRHSPTPDFALIQLDRAVIGHRPLETRKSDDIHVSEEVLAIGFPSGLPEKITLGAQVRSVNLSRFVADLDTFAGNSGSPVFNRRSGLIEGVLTSGEEDYVEDKKSGCFRVRYCGEQDKCKGETVTKINVLNWYPDTLAALRVELP